MKQVYLFLFCCALCTAGLRAQCGSLHFNDQEELDLFFSNNPDLNCSEVAGNVVIGSYWPMTGVNHLSPLSQINSIGGSLIISRSALYDLGGLHNLTHLEGSLTITENSHLIDLSALNRLKYLGGNLYISNNSVIADINFLDSLEYFGGEIIEIKLNGNLEAISGLNGNGLDSIRGDLTIALNHSLREVSGLNNIEVVEGRLNIHDNSSLEVVSGLNSLNSLQGNFYFYRNEGLNDISGFTALDTIGGQLFIHESPNLLSLEGLENLRILRGEIHLWGTGIRNFSGLESLERINHMYLVGNENLEDFSGLGNLTSLGSVEMHWHQSFSSLAGLENIDTIENLLITQSGRIKDFSGLESLKYIKRNLQLHDFDSLQSMTGLENLEFIGERLILNSHPLLNNLYALSNLDSIGSLGLYKNTALYSLHGLHNLQYIANSISIRQNEVLEDITALSNVTSFAPLSEDRPYGNYFRILENPVLSSLSGLENIDYKTIRSVQIEDNESLNTCEVESICIHLAKERPAEINNNGPGCKKVNVIKEACGINGDYFSFLESGQASTFTVFPNPSDGVFTVLGIKDEMIKIYNQFGQLLFEDQIEDGQLNLNEFASGIYFLEVIKKGERIIEKLSIQ